MSQKEALVSIYNATRMAPLQAHEHDQLKKLATGLMEFVLKHENNNLQPEPGPGDSQSPERPAGHSGDNDSNGAGAGNGNSPRPRKNSKRVRSH